MEGRREREREGLALRSYTTASLMMGVTTHRTRRIERIRHECLCRSESAYQEREGGMEGRRERGRGPCTEILHKRQKKIKCFFGRHPKPQK